MFDVSALGDAGILSPPPAQESGGDLGQEDFLTLMISQFRNQDPFEPMDNGDFLGQLAQFGTVNGIEQLNSAFAGLAGSIQSDQALQADKHVKLTAMGDAFADRLQLSLKQSQVNTW